jgi:hypothetical protein
MGKVLLAILAIGMMVSCVEERGKFVIVRNVSGDTTTLHKVRVDKDFSPGEVVFPLNKLNRVKIVRECRR